MNGFDNNYNDSNGSFNNSRTGGGGSTKRKKNIKTPVRKRPKPNSKYDAYNIDPEITKRESGAYGDILTYDPITGEPILTPVVPVNPNNTIGEKYNNLVKTNYLYFNYWLYINCTKYLYTIANNIYKNNTLYTNNINYNNYSYTLNLFTYLLIKYVYIYNLIISQSIIRVNKLIDNVIRYENIVVIKESSFYLVLREANTYNNIKKGIGKYNNYSFGYGDKYNNWIKGKFYVSVYFNPIYQGDITLYKYKTDINNYYKNYISKTNSNKYNLINYNNDSYTNKLFYDLINVYKSNISNNVYKNNVNIIQVKRYNEYKDKVVIVENNVIAFTKNYNNVNIGEIKYYNSGKVGVNVNNINIDIKKTSSINTKLPILTGLIYTNSKNINDLSKINQFKNKEIINIFTITNAKTIKRIKKVNNNV